METYHSEKKKQSPVPIYLTILLFSLFSFIIIIMTVLSRFANKVVIVTGNPYLSNVDMVQPK